LGERRDLPALQPSGSSNPPASHRQWIGHCSGGGDQPLHKRRNPTLLWQGLRYRWAAGLPATQVWVVQASLTSSLLPPCNTCLVREQEARPAGVADALGQLVLANFAALTSPTNRNVDLPASTGVLVEAAGADLDGGLLGYHPDGLLADTPDGASFTVKGAPWLNGTQGLATAPSEAGSAVESFAPRHRRGTRVGGSGSEGSLLDPAVSCCKSRDQWRRGAIGGSGRRSATSATAKVRRSWLAGHSSVVMFFSWARPQGASTPAHYYVWRDQSASNRLSPNIREESPWPRVAQSC
jgi:hypothetical protein